MPNRHLDRAWRLFAALLPLAACHPSQSQGLPPGIVADVQLQRAGDCDALASNIRATAVQQMRSQLDGLKQDNGYLPVLAGSANGAGGSATPAASGPASFSTTNVQVTGVDEADFMKNDGTRIFALANQTLYASSSWPPQDLSLRGQIDIEGWPTSLFLDGNQVAVFSSLWSYTDYGVVSPAELPVGGGPIACGIDGYGCFPYLGATKVTVIDVSDMTQLKVTSQVYLPGQLAGARRVQDSVRMVLTDGVRWPSGIQWYPNYDPSYETDHDAWVAAIDAIEDSNQALIEAAPLSNWFPQGSIADADGGSEPLTYSCNDFYVSNAPEELGLVTVATFDMTNLSAGISRAGIVGAADTLYSTADHLYVASQHWWWWDSLGEQSWTYLHEFDLSDPTQPIYVASGGVAGTIGDSFSLDEQDNYLRVATSTSIRSNDPSAVDGALAGSKLTVLGAQKGTDSSGAPVARLAKVGEIASLEDNERITAMRFVGNVGYAVTFRAIDPLVTLDLSDPAQPKKIAELTVPGFSTYVQPIDANHLLTIGEDFPVDTSGIPDYSHESLQLSLYDVSDLTHPVRTALQLVGTAWSESEAEYDHHAFNWYQPDPTKPGLLAIPFADWSDGGEDWTDGFVSDVRVFSVDPAGTISPQGALGMSDVYLQYGDGDWSYWYQPWVRRSVLATDESGANYVYAVSDSGLRVAPLGALNQPLATALYPSSISTARAKVTAQPSSSRR